MYCIFINTTVIWGPAQKSIIIWKDTNTRVIHCWQNSWKKHEGVMTSLQSIMINNCSKGRKLVLATGGNKAHVITWLCKTYHPYTRHTTYILVCISVYLNMYIYMYITYYIQYICHAFLLSELKCLKGRWIWITPTWTMDDRGIRWPCSLWF